MEKLEVAEEIIYKTNCQVYVLADDRWVERGRGALKIVVDKSLFLKFERNTDNSVFAKILIGNDPECQLVQHAGNDRTWTLTGKETSIQGLLEQIWAFRFQTIELAQAFQKSFQDCKANFFQSST